jgi:predicted NBD/HSP70 family sugar kinase
LVHLFVGNVVDAAIVSGTTPVRGPGSTAGTVAHLPFGDPATTCGCGRSGCLEAEVAEWAVLRRAGKASIAEVVDAAARGEPEPHRLLRHRAETLGRAAAVLLDVINPEVLVITEPGIARVPDLLAALREVVAEHSHTCPDPHRTVVAGSFPRDDVLAVAAGAVQLDAVFSNPTALADRLAPT